MFPHSSFTRRFVRVLACLLSSACAAVVSLGAFAFSEPANSPDEVLARSLAAGRAVDAIVEFDHAAADLAAQADRKRRGLAFEDKSIVALRAARYGATKRAVELAATSSDARKVRDFLHLPMAQWHLASAAALAHLRAQPSVRAIYPIRFVHTVATSDLMLIEQPAALAAGGAGAGTTTLVIDNGIDLTNSAFGTCPTPGASGCRVLVYQVDYPGTTPDTSHGTNVSGVIAEIATAGMLAMIDVFDGSSASSADILSALDWGIANQSAYNIVAANMSLGDGGSYTASSCPTDLLTATQDAAAVGITTIVASGNDGYSGGISWPACTSGAISVGAVYDTAMSGTLTWGSPTICTDTNPVVDQVTCFTNMSANLSLLAPGVNVLAAGVTDSGTSQATPHVAGSVAVLRARYPREALSQTLTRLSYTGTVDPRGGYSAPRIDEYKSLELGTALALTLAGPATAQAGATATYTLTVRNNGPLAATAISVADSLPALASDVSATSGCTVSVQTVTCEASSLAVNASIAFTINVRWTGSGAVFDTATLSADQIDSTPADESASLGSPPSTTGAQADVPLLPPWAFAVLALSLSGGFRLHKTRLRRR